MATLPDLLKVDYKIANNIPDNKAIKLPANYISEFNKRYKPFLSNFPENSELRNDAIREMKKSIEGIHSNNEALISNTGGIKDDKFNQAVQISCNSLKNKYSNIDFTSLGTVKEQYTKIAQNEQGVKKVAEKFEKISKTDKEYKELLAKHHEEFKKVKYGTKEYSDFVQKNICSDYLNLSKKDKIVVDIIVHTEHKFLDFEEEYKKEHPNAGNNEIEDAYLKANPNVDEKTFKGKRQAYGKASDREEAKKNAKEARKNGDDKLAEKFEKKAQELDNQFNDLLEQGIITENDIKDFEEEYNLRDKENFEKSDGNLQSNSELENNINELNQKIDNENLFVEEVNDEKVEFEKEEIENESLEMEDLFVDDLYMEDVENQNEFDQEYKEESVEEDNILPGLEENEQELEQETAEVENNYVINESDSIDNKQSQALKIQTPFDVFKRRLENFRKNIVSGLKKAKENIFNIFNKKDDEKSKKAEIEYNELKTSDSLNQLSQEFIDNTDPNKNTDLLNKKTPEVLSVSMEKDDTKKESDGR